MICDSCDGTGVEKGDNRSVVPLLCKKCQGEKKLDWISKITGVPEKDFLTVDSSASCSFSSTALTANSIYVDNKPMEQYIQDIVIKKLAEEIDKRILDAIIKHKEQTNKKRRAVFDNRIFSKLMFFRNSK